MRPIYTIKRYFFFIGLLFAASLPVLLTAQVYDCEGASPIIEVAVDIVGVDYPQSSTCGHFNVLIDVTLTNAGPLDVDHIAAEMDLAGAFGSTFVSLVSGPVSLDGIIAQGELNAGFTGEAINGNTSLIGDENAILRIGESSKMRLVAELAPDNDPVQASSKLAKVVAKAKAVLASQDCYTALAEDSEALGDCWQKSRVKAANDQINVTLGACTALITPDMILENHFTACDAGVYPEGGFYRLKLIGPGDVVLAEGPTVTVTDPSVFNDGKAIIWVESVSDQCHPVWGYVQLEDKTGTVVAECPSDVYTACIDREVQKIAGVIPAADDLNTDVVNFGSYSCFIENKRLPSCDRAYDLVPFQVDKTDIYTFELSMAETPGLMAIYQERFDPDKPCENIIGQSDVAIFDEAIFPTDDRLEARIRMVLPLKPGISYYLLTTHARCHTEAERYSYSIYSDGTGRLKNIVPKTERVCYELLCDDVPHILNQPESVKYLPSPIFTDNCTSQTDLDVRFQDQLVENGDCGDLYIVRTWKARDEAGNEEAVCEQTIHFRRPSLRDIYKPNTTVPIECDEDYPTLPNGNPHPDHTGYPYVVSAFGIHDLKESYCNVGADFEDIARIDVCDDSYKIVRQWTLVDWCRVGNQSDLNNSTLSNFRQIIKIGDFTAPKIECPQTDLEFVTGPFDCTASVPLLPPVVTDNCSNDWTINVQILTKTYRSVYDKYGNFLYFDEEEVILAQGQVGTYVSNIPTGSHTMRYIVVDNCGNRAVKDCSFTVKDGVAPVAVCDDALNVSIGGEGIARLTAKDVNEGSWDNCSPVGLKVSRSFASSACRDDYLQQVYHLSFGELEKIAITGPDGETAIYVDKTTKKDTILRQRGSVFLTWWEDAIFFTCCDITQQVTIELLAVDGDGRVSSYWSGGSNGNYCWFDLTVEDKIAPNCIAPANVQLLCTELPSGFNPDDISQLTALFGAATGVDNCPGYTVTELPPSSRLNCGAGTITRTFEVKDAQEKKALNPCVQIIEILEQHAYEIKFPKDASFYCGQDPMPDTIAYTEQACDLLTVSAKDEFFEASGDECYKIFRTYRVINWCEYDGESNPVIVGRDEDCDGKPGDEEVWVLVRADGSVYFDRDNNENNSVPAAQTKELRCDQISNPKGHWISTAIDGSASPSRDISSNGFWQYTQVIKVFDNTAPKITINRNEPFCVLSPDKCTGEVFIPFTVQDGCSHYRNFSVQVFYDEYADNTNLINITGVGLVNRYPKYTLVGEYPIGKHIFELVVSDGCGNTTSLKIPFEVVDCKVASPSCIHGLSVELMRTEPGTDADGDGDEDAGAMTIWATDFVASPITDCFGPVTFSINRAGDTPSPDQKALIVTCDDEGILPVEIYAWDKGFNPYLIQPDGTKGGPNYDFCETVLYVQDNMFDLCDGGGRISVSGLVVTEEQEGVENVEMRISGGVSNSIRTPADGGYSLSGLTPGGDYTIAPLLDEDHLNGVSTFDIVLISKHILGIKKLDTPYKLIAADVNKSGSISALDIIQLRKVILSIDRQFRNNTSWRFIRAGYKFPNPSNPWQETFPEIVNYNDLGASISNADFIAVKIGDVNLNARANSQVGTGRSLAGETYLEIPYQEIRSGQTFTIPLYLAQPAALEGLQFGLQWDAESLEMQDVEYGLVQPAHLGTNWSREGILLVSWDRRGENASDQLLLSLTFRAKRDSRVEELFALNRRFLQPEAYNFAEETLDLKMRMKASSKEETSFALYQNQPNPFSTQTQIQFYLPESMEASLSVYDVTGKLLYMATSQYESGLQQLEVDRTQLPSSGVLYYTLKAGAYTATRKMILLE